MTKKNRRRKRRLRSYSRYGAKIRKVNGLWTPEAVLGLRTKHGWTQAEMAYELGVSPVTVHRWEGGHARTSKLAVRLLTQLAFQKVASSRSARGGR